MKQITTVEGLSDHLLAVRARGARVGLVPTMGALHAGHGSLVERARRDGCTEIVTTIFVNPLQFGPTEDLSKYPRELDVDASLAEAAGATVLFAPSVVEMYPFGPNSVLTTVSVRALTNVLDGVARPGHFDGVATVVAKLFAMTGACTAYFGEKDYQQLAVIRRMCTDLSFPIQVVGCPTVREPDGLAMSSRNRYLSPDERQRATVIWRALQTGVQALANGERAGQAIALSMRRVLEAESIVSAIDYAACVDPTTLAAVDHVEGEIRLLVAARVGPARLIDNCAALPSP